MKGEDEVIERIRRRLPARPGSSAARELRLGIGDDAAILRFCAGGGRGGRAADWVLSCDALLENVHFLAPVHPADAVGYRALARATSDLAAMGATPRYFLMGLALPSDRTHEWLDKFLGGMARAARRFRIILAGGDTAQHATIAVYLTVLGQIAPNCAVTRGGARPGDRIYVSGKLGGAQLGLELILRGLYRERRWRPLLTPHFYPSLQLSLGRRLAEQHIASAMIDTSDGFSTDLAHICRVSGVGARVWANQIPVVGVPPGLREHALDSLELALHGGEDYQLLFTVPPRQQPRVPKTVRGIPITAIGEIVRGRSIVLVGRDTKETPLEPRGWDHFRGMP